MASFAVHSAKQLADFITPLSQEAANVIFLWLANTPHVYAAVYGLDVDGKLGKWVINALREDGCTFIYLGEYHPRKDGKATLIFKNN